MTYSIIKKSQLEGTHRLDAEYYQPEYLELERNLLKFKSLPLSELASVDGGKRLPIGEIFSEEGIPYQRIVDIYDTFINSDQIKFISEKLHQQLGKYQIKLKDILVTIVGTTGLVGYNQLDLSKFNFTENCARVRSKQIIPECLLAILLSKIGQLQVEREKVGTAQPKLSLDRLRKFLIPIFNKSNQLNIRKYITEALKDYNESKNKYAEAENLLLEELGLNNFKAEDDSFLIISLEEVKMAKRIDAEYFQKKYQQLFKSIRKHDLKILDQLVTVKKGIEPGSEAYQEEGKLFIRVSSLSKFGIEQKDQQFLSDDLYQKFKKDFEPKVNEILLTKDATPGIAYTIKEPIEGIISLGILRLFSIKSGVEPEYLTLCINSIIGKWQAERDSGGSVIAHWKTDQIKNLLIPILPIQTQQKIADLVKKSHEARKKSKELLEEAKQKVEEIIEKSI